MLSPDEYPWISLGLNMVTQQIIVMYIWKEKPENPIPEGLNEEEQRIADECSHVRAFRFDDRLGLSLFVWLVGAGIPTTVASESIRNLGKELYSRL